MFRRFSLLLFLLALAKTVSALSADPCVLKATSNIEPISSISCELKLKSLGCESYFQANHIPKEKMRSCDDHKSAGTEAFLESCSDGAGGFFTQLYDSTIGSLKTQSDKYEAEKQKQRLFERICEQDQSLSIKRSLEIGSRLEGFSHPMTDEKLKSVSCGKLMDDVQARTNFREFQQYVDKLDTPEFRSQWDDTRKKALMSLKEKVVSAAAKAGVILQCYNATAKAEIGCKIASALVTGGAIKDVLAGGSAVAAEEGVGASSAEETLASRMPENLSSEASGDQVLTIPGTQYNWRLDPTDVAHVQDHIWSKGTFKDLSINDYQVRQETFYNSLTSISDQEEVLKRRNLEISQTLKNADPSQKKQLGATLNDEFKKNTDALDKLKKQRLALVNVGDSYLPANATSYFTSQNLETVIKQVSKLPPSQIEHVNKPGFQSSMYRATIKSASGDTRVVVVVCEKTEGCLREGRMVAQGRPLTIYPECGPDVVKLNYGKGSLLDSLAQKDANGKTIRIPASSLVSSVKCQ